MNNNTLRIDLRKLFKYILRRIWIPVICAIIGFAALYCYTTYNTRDMYTASGTMYVYNGNPNAYNYQYANKNDLDSAVRLIETYMVVVKSKKVMEAVAERLSADYPDIPTELIAATLSMAPVSETGVVRVSSVSPDPQMSADICNAVLDVAPAEIIRVVSVGGVEIIDYAETPLFPNSRGTVRNGILGAAAGFVIACIVLLILFLFNRKVIDAKELTDNYTPPVLANVKRYKKDSDDAGDFMLTDKSSMEMIEGYAKLRMNLLYTLVGKDSNVIVVTSAISGEGKSTIASNLAISCGMGKKKVLLIDGDMRRACQTDIFGSGKSREGLSEILVGECRWQDVVKTDIREGVDLIQAGNYPPNPSELLGSGEMKALLEELQKEYDLIILDMPPVNIVSDPLVVSSEVAGCIFVVRQRYTDHRDVRRSLISAEMTGMDVLGFVFYGEKIQEGSYYSRKYYKNYYNKYDYRRNPAGHAEEKPAEKDDPDDIRIDYIEED